MKLYTEFKECWKTEMDRFDKAGFIIGALFAIFFIYEIITLMTQ